MSDRRPFNPDRRALIGSFGALLAASALPFPALAQSGGAAKSRIGIIGSGKIGGTVGSLWVKAGHEVMFSSRHPEELKDLVAGLGSLAHAGSVAQAIAFSNTLFVAIPYGALPQLDQDYGAQLKGKIVLDAGNANAGRDGAIADEAEKNGIGVTSQKYLPGTHVVRAFNTLSYMILAREANRTPPRMAIPIAGDDPAAVKEAARLVSDAGFDPVVVGGLAKASLFQRGGPGYGQAVTAPELRQTLNLAP
ncbi:MAG TPA: NAD(P)-binding domain-containing protein [Stellaceae bacterium]|jgi:predicted dinucleotide-binding enzyme|nr:NAD(P)-binding domain-containing protein [Stellaceae bacterium]